MPVCDMNPEQVGHDLAASALHLTVHGRVHGVGFRAAMTRMARARQVDGWVRNRADGTVEAVVRGSTLACDLVVHWSHHGPAAARVDRVDVRAASAEESAIGGHGFRCLDTW
jgi:acylphosphatase